MPFHVSSPLLDLMNASAARPARVNAVVNRRLARGLDSRMRPGDHYPSLLRRLTGLNVVGISRASGNLLLNVESREPLWRYHEVSRNKCLLTFIATVPETLKDALVGKPAGRLVLTHEVLDDLPIGTIEQDGAWTVAFLKPEWHRF